MGTEGWSTAPASRAGAGLHLFDDAASRDVGMNDLGNGMAARARCRRQPGWNEWLRAVVGLRLFDAEGTVVSKVRSYASDAAAADSNDDGKMK